MYQTASRDARFPGYIESYLDFAWKKTETDFKVENTFQIG